MQKRHGMFVVSGVLMGVMLAGCAPTRLEMDYGNSYRLARAQQILLPEGEKNLAPQEGPGSGKQPNTRSNSIAKRLSSHRHRPRLRFLWVL